MTMRLISLLAVLLLCLSTLSGQKTIPQVYAKDIQENVIDLSEYTKDGKPKLISLWATWCGPCRLELKALNKVYQRWQEEYELEIVAISLDTPRMVKAAKKMFEKNKWPFTFMYDHDEKLMSAFQISGIPYSILVNGKGEIASTQTGYSSNYEKALEKKLMALK